MGPQKRPSGFGEPEPEPEIEDAQRELVEQRVIAPLELGGADECAWTDCELASFAENRLGERPDPGELDDARRADWSGRATTERLWRPSAREVRPRLLAVVTGAREARSSECARGDSRAAWYPSSRA